jgi:hypothetical protein
MCEFTSLIIIVRRIAIVNNNKKAQEFKMIKMIDEISDFTHLNLLQSRGFRRDGLACVIHSSYHFINFTVSESRRVGALRARGAYWERSHGHVNLEESLVQKGKFMSQALLLPSASSFY